MASVLAWFGAGTAAAAGTAAVVLPTVTVTATTLATAAAVGLTAAEVAAIGIGAAGAYGASGGFDSGGDGGGSGGGNDAGGGSQLTAQDLYDLGYEFDMPLDDAAVANMTQEAGTSLGLEKAGFSWTDGLGWLKTGLGLFNAAAGAYAQYKGGKNAAGNADAAARDSRLSAEDAKRRAAQLELWGLDQAKLQQPWDENGGRALAGEQLRALLSDPAGVAANDPAYKLRMQAAARAMGIYGQDSGAMGVAAADASSSWYDQRLAQLAGLSGATAPPGAGGQLGYNTLTGAANIAGMGQASGAFGNQATGAANNARNSATLGTINAAGQLVDTVGRLIGGNSGGGDYRFTVGVTDPTSASGGATTGTPGATIGANGKPGHDASTSTAGGAPVPSSGGPYPDPEYDAAGLGKQPPVAISQGPFLPGADQLGGGPFVGPLQQMQGLGQFSDAPGPNRPRYLVPNAGSTGPLVQRDPSSALGPGQIPAPAGYARGPTPPMYTNDSQASMSNMGQFKSPGQGYASGPYLDPEFGSGRPPPNAQGNNIGPPGTIDPTIGALPLEPGDQTQNMSDLGYFSFGGDLLGNYLKPRGLAQSRGG